MTGRLSLLFLVASVLFLISIIAAVASTSSSPAMDALVEIRLEGQDGPQVDRCATCHRVPVGAELPGDHPAVPGYHPVERFGCAGCHGGEPRALERRWAHGEGRQPLLHLSSLGDEPRRERLEGACARCHVEVSGAGLTYDAVLLPHVTAGQDLFLSRGCWGCHRLADVSLGERGPDLSDAGARLTGDELHVAIEDPSAAPSSTSMPNLRLPESEIRDLVTFLIAQVGSAREAAVATSRELRARRPGAPPVRPSVNPGMARGGEVMLRFGCVGCHRLQSRDGQVGPDLRWEGDLRGPRYVNDMILRPASTVVGSRMPPLDLSASEVTAVQEFLARQREIPPETDEAAWRGICARCHGLDGRGRTAVAPYLSRRPRDLSEGEFFRGVEPNRLVAALRRGVPGTPMAPWAEAVPVLGGKRVVSYLSRKLHHGVLPSPRRLEVPRPPEKIADEHRLAAKRIFQVECSACHGPSGRGDGREAEGLRPRPRDLTNGAFITALSTRRMYLSIAYGPVGSAMPGHLWGSSPEVIWALGARVRRLAGPPLTGDYSDDFWPWQRGRGRNKGADRPRRTGSKRPSRRQKAGTQGAPGVPVKAAPPAGRPTPRAPSEPSQ